MADTTAPGWGKPAVVQAATEQMPGRDPIADRLAASIPWLGHDAGPTVAGMALLALAEHGLAVVPAHQDEHARPEPDTHMVALEELLATIWLHISWRQVTRQLTTDQKNLFADAVEASARRANAADPALNLTARVDRWWQDAPADGDTPYVVQQIGSWLPYSPWQVAEITGRPEEEIRDQYGDTVLVCMTFSGPTEFRRGGPTPSPAEIRDTRQVIAQALAGPPAHRCDNCDGIDPNSCINTSPTTPANLRQRYAEALIARIRRSVMIDQPFPDGRQGQPFAATEYDLADAVMAVRDDELERWQRAVVRVVRLARDMRDWCSPHGIAVSYSDRIAEAILGAPDWQRTGEALAKLDDLAAALADADDRWRKAAQEADDRFLRSHQLLGTVLATFTERGHPGRPAIRSSWTAEDLVSTWRQAWLEFCLPGLHQPPQRSTPGGGNG